MTSILLIVTIGAVLAAPIVALLVAARRGV